MNVPRWTLRVYYFDRDGNPVRSPVRTRKCNSGDLAKAWGRRWAHELLRDGAGGVRCNITDPTGKPWAKADVLAIKPGRLEWTWM